MTKHTYPDGISRTPLEVSEFLGLTRWGWYSRTRRLGYDLDSAFREGGKRLVVPDNTGKKRKKGLKRRSKGNKQHKKAELTPEEIQARVMENIALAAVPSPTEYEKLLYA